MPSQNLSKILDKLDGFLQTQKGAIGSPRAADVLTRISHIQRHIQNNPGGISSFSKVNTLLDKLEAAVGKEVSAS